MHFLADDQSVLSSFTTISTDSNTPSVVGETLRSISLNDHAHKKGKWYAKVAEIIEIEIHIFIDVKLCFSIISSHIRDRTKGLARMSED
jgi:hypothetical protein